MFRRIALLAVPFLISATMANAAAVLVSPSVSVTNLGNSLDCRIVNTGNEAITVLFEMVDGNGIVILDDTINVPAGGARAINLTNTSAAAQCRFSGSFKRKAVRASVEVLDANFRTIAIAPAQ
jgi:hypothetical protein